MRRQVDRRQGRLPSAARNLFQGAMGAVGMLICQWGAEMDEERCRGAFNDAYGHDSYNGNRNANFYEGSGIEYTARRGLRRIAIKVT